MTTTISKWGNSQGLRLPKNIVNDLHLAVGDVVNIFVKDSKVIIEPIKKERVKYDINMLVSKIPKEYLPHEEITSTLGNEAW